MNDTEKKIRELIFENIEITVPVEQISSQDDLFQFGMDSISSIKLIVAIESVFDFEFSDEDLNMDNIKTIDSIAEYLHKNIYHG